MSKCAACGKPGAMGVSHVAPEIPSDHGLSDTVLNEVRFAVWYIGEHPDARIDELPPRLERVIIEADDEATTPPTESLWARRLASHAGSVLAHGGQP